MSEFSEVRARIEAARDVSRGWTDRRRAIYEPMSAALLAILDLHGIDEDQECPPLPSCCICGDHYPCPTVAAVHAAFGLDRSKEQHHE